MMAAIGGRWWLTDDERIRADVNQDGQVDNSDLMELRYYLVNHGYLV